MLMIRLPFYQDKLHEETVFRRFTEILAKARANKNSNKPETELKEFEAVRDISSRLPGATANLYRF